MTIFDNALLVELQALGGASHSFLKQVCSQDAAPLRDALSNALRSVPEPARSRLADLLRSLENRRFFQGFAELAALDGLLRSGWTVEDSDASGRLSMFRPEGRPCNLQVLSFLNPGHPGRDREAVQKLEQVLDRVYSKLKFAVFVRRSLPQVFDPEPVRQAVELWLREVEAGRWESRYAAYEDETVALEFGLIGDLERPARVDRQGHPVVMTLGPFTGGRRMGLVERRIIQELDRYRMGPYGTEHTCVIAVADRPWGIARGTMREFLYGKPDMVSSDPEVGWEATLSNAPEPCLFKDPLYAPVEGVMLLSRSPDEALAIGGRAWSNPFAERPLEAHETPFETVAEVRRDNGCPVLRRTGPGELVFVGQE
ncbi:MAG: hypothetical protein GY913_12615 [Proteobacteria bacterium]|nr:hypothetical protein [Pseudomonadota bacterium]MCP4917748.1 hypothetical protein [Pseudomonadota bacterium]